MNQWSQAKIRVTRIDITPAMGLERHVGVGYEVLVGDRVVHQAGLTIHGPAGENSLPDDLASLVEALWRHAQERVAELEGLGVHAVPEDGQRD
jgi:hypothetical protein